MPEQKVPAVSEASVPGAETIPLGGHGQTSLAGVPLLKNAPAIPGPRSTSSVPALGHPAPAAMGTSKLKASASMPVVSMPYSVKAVSSLGAALHSVARSVQSAVESALGSLWGQISRYSSPEEAQGFPGLGGGQIGPNGGFAPLLLCVLSSGFILLLWSGRLLRFLSELPKPSSALLLPLERPG